jgi:hypothetical protein
VATTFSEENGMNITLQTENTELKIQSYPPTEIMRVDLDGGFTVNESIPATDAAIEVLRLMKEQWFYDKQATKIRELQDRIKLLDDASHEILSWIPYKLTRDHATEIWNKAKDYRP